jgi:hypothetical protein
VHACHDYEVAVKEEVASRDDCAASNKSLSDEKDLQLICEMYNARRTRMMRKCINMKIFYALLLFLFISKVF